jgi:hypothetical protein
MSGLLKTICNLTGASGKPLVVDSSNPTPRANLADQEDMSILVIKQEDNSDNHSNLYLSI